MPGYLKMLIFNLTVISNKNSLASAQFLCNTETMPFMETKPAII